VELSLRSGTGGGGGGRGAPPAVEKLEVGSDVRGRVRRVEKFGIFVDLDEPLGATGLAHISEVADGFVKDIDGLFAPGQGARRRERPRRRTSARQTRQTDRQADRQAGREDGR
jgi:rRNA biogenesis protein RRP5